MCKIHKASIKAHLEDHKKTHTEGALEVLAATQSKKVFNNWGTVSLSRKHFSPD